jgi:kinesin family protein C1
MHQKQSQEYLDKVGTLQSQVESLEHQLHLADTERSMLQAQFEASQKEVERLSSDREDALNENSSSTEALKRQQEELEKMGQTIEGLRQEIKEKQLQIKKFERDLKQAHAERDDARKRMETFDDREEELFRKLRESDRIRRELHNKVMQLSGNIRVFVRVRPELPGEHEKEQKLLAEKASSDNTRKRKHDEMQLSETPFKFPGLFDGENGGDGQDLTKNLVEVLEPHKDRGGLKERRKKYRFGFDNVFTPNQGQDDIWEATEPLVQSAIDGYNVCIFAYGQTGSGKTYTMLGDQSNEGIVARAVAKLFNAKAELEALSKGTTTVSISVELLEIYNEQVRDLLSTEAQKDQNLKVTSMDVVGNILAKTSCSEEVMQALAIAQARRCVKATNSNSESSRSHMVFTIHFNVTSDDGITRKGKLHICDLAGSERLSKSGANSSVGGSLLKETKAINSSLSVLSNVIEKLQQGSPNVPFRESKLTMILQNSLGGNSKTLAIVCCNPMASHYHESLSSLRFADKVNKVELKAVSNFSC